MCFTYIKYEYILGCARVGIFAGFVAFYVKLCWVRMYLGGMYLGGGYIMAVLTGHWMLRGC